MVYQELLALALLLLLILLLDLHILLEAHHLNKDILLRANKDTLLRASKDSLPRANKEDPDTLRVAPSTDTLNRGTLLRAMVNKDMDSLLSRVTLNRVTLSRAISSLLKASMAIQGMEWPQELPQGPLLDMEHPSISSTSSSSTLPSSSMELLLELLVLLVVPLVGDPFPSTWIVFSEQYRRMEFKASTLLSDCSRLPAPLVL